MTLLIGFILFTLGALFGAALTITLTEYNQHAGLSTGTTPFSDAELEDLGESPAITQEVTESTPSEYGEDGDSPRAYTSLALDTLFDQLHDHWGVD